MSEDTNASFTIPDSEFAEATSPRDLKGRINLRIDQALQQEIEDIADDRRYPLNSSSEVVRYCCLLGLERLRQWQPAPSLLGQIKAASALVMRDKLQCDALDLLDRLDERIKWYIENSKFDEVIDIVAKVRANFDQSSEFWAVHIRENIDLRFASWMSVIDGLRKDE